jgi:hypothetical protein
MKLPEHELSEQELRTEQIKFYRMTNGLLAIGSVALAVYTVVKIIGLFL